MHQAHQKRRIQQHLVGATVWWLSEMHPTHGSVLSVSHHGPHGYWYRVEGESSSISGARVYATAEELAQDLLTSTQQMAAAKAYYESPHISRLQLPGFEPPYVYRVSIVEVYRAPAADITRELGYYCTFDAALHVIQAAKHGDPMQHSQRRQIHRYQLGAIREPEVIWSQGWEHRGSTWTASSITSTVPLYAASTTFQALGFEAVTPSEHSADGGPLWVCLQMIDERRGLWYRTLSTGTVQIRAGREGDDDIAILHGEEAAALVKCLARVSCMETCPQPFAPFSQLVKSREWHRARRARRVLPDLPMTTQQELEARIREIPLIERLEECTKRLGKMCSERRAPRMSIPVSWDDDDFFMALTFKDARAALRENAALCHAEGRGER